MAYQSQFPISVVDGTNASTAIFVDGVWRDGLDHKVDHAVAGAPSLRCKLQIAGSARYQFAGENECATSKGEYMFIHHPAGCEKREIVEPGVEERSVVVCFPVSSTHLGVLERNDPAVDRALERMTDRLLLRRGTIPKHMLAIVHALFDIDVESRTAKLLRRAKIDELSCILLDLFLGDYDAPAGYALTARDRRHAREVYEIIRGELSSALTVSDLAARVGSNRAKLTTAFRTIYGETVHQCVQRERMIRAGALIKADNYSMGDIAEMVGYGHLSNFSIAFKNYFGVAPSSMRNAN